MAFLLILYLIFTIGIQEALCTKCQTFVINGPDEVLTFSTPKNSNRPEWYPNNADVCWHINASLASLEEYVIQVKNITVLDLGPPAGKNEDQCPDYVWIDSQGNFIGRAPEIWNGKIGIPFKESGQQTTSKWGCMFGPQLLKVNSFNIYFRSSPVNMYGGFTLEVRLIKDDCKLLELSDDKIFPVELPVEKAWSKASYCWKVHAKSHVPSRVLLYYQDDVTVRRFLDVYTLVNKKWIPAPILLLESTQNKTIHASKSYSEYMYIFLSLYLDNPANNVEAMYIQLFPVICDFQMLSQYTPPLFLQLTSPGTDHLVKTTHPAKVFDYFKSYFVQCWTFQSHKDDIWNRMNIIANIDRLENYRAGVVNVSSGNAQEHCDLDSETTSAYQSCTVSTPGTTLYLDLAADAVHLKVAALVSAALLCHYMQFNANKSMTLQYPSKTDKVTLTNYLQNHGCMIIQFPGARWEENKFSLALIPGIALPSCSSWQLIVDDGLRYNHLTNASTFGRKLCGHLDSSTITLDIHSKIGLTVTLNATSASQTWEAFGLDLSLSVAPPDSSTETKPDLKPEVPDMQQGTKSHGFHPAFVILPVCLILLIVLSFLAYKLVKKRSSARYVTVNRSLFDNVDDGSVF